MAWKQQIAKIPVIGYLCRLAVDLVTLPVVRRDLHIATRDLFGHVANNERALEEMRGRLDAMEDCLQHTLQSISNQLLDLASSIDALDRTGIYNSGRDRAL